MFICKFKGCQAQFLDNIGQFLDNIGKFLDNIGQF